MTNFGTYRLGESITSYEHLTEFSSLEYKIIKKTFPGEHIFKAPSVFVLDRVWEVTLSSLPGGKVYKIAAQFMSSQRDELEATFSVAYDYYDRELGTPPTVTESGAYRWDRPFGNLLLGRAGVGGLGCVNCIITSDIRPFLTIPPKRPWYSSLVRWR